MRQASFAFYYVCEKVFDECKAMGAKIVYKLHTLPILCYISNIKIPCIHYNIHVDIITKYLHIFAPFQHFPWPLKKFFHIERLRDNSFSCSAICMKTKRLWIFNNKSTCYQLMIRQTYCRLIFNFYVDLCCRGESISRPLATLPKWKIITKKTQTFHQNCILRAKSSF